MKRLSSFFIALTFFFPLANTETLATVSDAEIITDEATDLSKLNREADKAHEKLDKIFDLQAIKEEQEYTKIAGELMQQAMEPVIQALGDAYHKGEMGNGEHKLAHALIGCVTGGVVNGNCAAGAAGAVAGEIAAEAYLKSQVQKAYENGTLTEARYDEIRNEAIIAGQIAGGIAGASVGGDAGIASEAAKNAAENNAVKRGLLGMPILCGSSGDIIVPGCRGGGGGGNRGGGGRGKEVGIGSGKSDGVILTPRVPPNQMNQSINKGQAPRGIKRVDGGDIKHGEKPHVHIGNGHALNIDGTWKHGGTSLTNAQKKWLQNNGWKLPQ